MTGFVQNIDALARELAELTNIYIKRGAVLAEVGNEGGSLGLEGGAYAALRAVRTDIAKGEDFSEPSCVSSNVFNACAFRRNQLAITEKAARDYYASDDALCLVFNGKVLFYPLNRFQIVQLTNC